MSLIAPLPESLRSKLRHNTHPGLMLDKYVESWDEQADTGKLSERVQKPAIEAVVRMSHRAPASLELETLRERRQRMLQSLQARLFRCATTGPFTLHLARASALENAGICLHPLYGFVYLPGSGLKGMARAYAETVWKPQQTDEAVAQVEIESIFGNKPGEPKPECQHVGAVVFHEAWPTTWPQLMIDILNNHHSKYYGGDGPPGDWDNPIPVYFLAVAPETTFDFAISPRSVDVEASAMERAQEWLLGALCHLGAGAKTNAGYGSFQPVEAPRPALVSPRHAAFEATVELVTPGFLAGANQFDGQGCDLRPATLRGMLRWWWRTLHAGFLDVDTLRSLEAAIWGDTKAGGALRLEVVPRQLNGPMQFNFKDRYDAKPEFKQQHGLADSPDKKTTQGLFYASYGMDERSRGQSHHRFFLDAGSSWTVRLLASEAMLRSKVTNASKKQLTAADVLNQALTAMWLLCRYGAVGSKSRKGFGSLQISDVLSDASGVFGEWETIDDCRNLAGAFREAYGFANSCDKRNIQSSALGDPTHLPDCVEVSLPWSDPWKVMDEVGFAYQAFAKAKKHDGAKMALGLPRKIHGPRDDRPIGNQPDWRPSEWLDFPKRDHKTSKQNARYASPIHIHVAGDKGGRFVVRAIGFPAPYLPDLDTSRAFLQEFLASFRAELQRRVDSPAPVSAGAGRPSRPSRGRSPRDEAPAPPPSVSVPIVTHDELLQNLGELQEPRAMFKLQRSRGSGVYTAQKLRSAPNVKSGYQGDGGWQVTGAPEGLHEGTFVIANTDGREGRFQEVFGRLTPPPQPPGHPGRHRRR